MDEKAIQLLKAAEQRCAHKDGIIFRLTKEIERLAFREAQLIRRMEIAGWKVVEENGLLSVRRKAEE